jgi:cytochrome c biogenesis protein CcmG/thiol:disulfide interchange protein DsbE
MSDLLQDGPPEGQPADAATEAPARRRHPARVAAVAVALVLAVFVVLAAAVKSGTKDTAATPLLGQAAPVVRTTTIDGQPFDLATRRGSWVVVNFFSTWCVPCVREHPDLVRFAAGQAAQPDGAELYSVVFNDDPAKVQRFFADNGGDWPRLVDPDGRIQVAFGVAKSPETWIIDPNGVVRARIITTVTSEGLTSLLEQLQSGSPPAS